MKNSSVFASFGLPEPHRGLSELPEPPRCLQEPPKGFQMALHRSHKASEDPKLEPSRHEMDQIDRSASKPQQESRVKGPAAMGEALRSGRGSRHEAQGAVFKSRARSAA